MAKGYIHIFNRFHSWLNFYVCCGVLTMAEYINREALVEDFSLCGADKKLVEAIIYRIKLHPAADVVEVIHGQWVKTDKGQKCSNCNCLSSFWDDNLKSVFCPWCGAKMDGDKND